MRLEHKKSGGRSPKIKLEALVQHAKIIALVPIRICGWFIVASLVGMAAQSTTGTPALGGSFSLGYSVSPYIAQ